MASSCIRFVSRRVSFCSLRSLGVRSTPAAPPPHFVGGACATRRFTSLVRIPVELGCCGGSMFPLHSAVAAARLTSRLSATSRSDRALSQDKFIVLDQEVVQFRLECNDNVLFPDQIDGRTGNYFVPEYRPAASPTFVLTQHSNSHCKVMELRRQKEMLIIRHKEKAARVALPELLLGDKGVC